MAIGWMTVLKMVPWGDVIENAPKVASGAKKLWQSVGKGHVPEAPGRSEVAPSEISTIDSLQGEVAELRVAVADLHQQMLTSSELIQSLANQNTELIRRMELMRKRLLWISVWVLGLSAALVSRYF